LGHIVYFFLNDISQYVALYKQHNYKTSSMCSTIKIKKQNNLETAISYTFGWQ